MAYERRPKGATLPRRLSEVIRVALRDLASVERSRRYVVDMSSWHWASTLVDGSDMRPVCYVCLAGAVMARTLGADRSETVGPNIARTKWDERRLYALDAARRGELDKALVDEMELDETQVNRRLRRADVGDGLLWHVVPPYEYDPRGFKRSMRRMADVLEEVGL